MKTAIVLTVLFCAALIGGAVFFAVNQGSGGPRIIAFDPAYTTRSEKGFWARGAAEPKVVITEYGDFQCPGCRAMYPLIHQAVEQNSETVQLNFRNYPLVTIHDKAKLAAEAAEAAGRQGKFWEMHNLLYSRQDDWSTISPVVFRKRLEEYATSANLNLDQFKRDLNDNTIDDEINEDVVAGNELRVSSTPTLFINGKKLDSLPSSVDQLNQLIQQELANATQ